jgi:hypothetical protein
MMVLVVQLVRGDHPNRTGEAIVVVLNNAKRISHRLETW